MLMPLLVRPTDSEIEAVDHVVSKISNSLQDVFCVAEEIRAIGLPIHHQPLFPDLHIQPVYGDAQLRRQLLRGKSAGAMGPSRAGAREFDARSKPDFLHSDGENLVLAAMTGSDALRS